MAPKEAHREAGNRTCVESVQSGDRRWIVRVRWLVVPAILATGCGSELQAGATGGPSDGAATTTVAQLAVATSVSGNVASSSEVVPLPASTTLGPVIQQVRVEVQLPAFDGPATVWRVPPMLPDPARLAQWGIAFGFSQQEIDATTGTRIARSTADGQVLDISESTGRWVFMDGPAGMYAVPGSCPLPALAPPPSTTAGAPAMPLPPGQRCADPPPSGIPDPTAAVAQARALWNALGIDLTDASVSLGGDEYLREVIASDQVGGISVARLHVVIGAKGRLLRATGSLGAPVPAASVPRVDLVEALDRFARQPPSAGPETTTPASFDGVYRVIGAASGLTTFGDHWLLPSYEVSLADGRTITLLAIDPTDFPTD